MPLVKNEFNEHLAHVCLPLERRQLQYIEAILVQPTHIELVLVLDDIIVQLLHIVHPEQAENTVDKDFPADVQWGAIGFRGVDNLVFVTIINV